MNTETLKIKTSGMTVYESILLREVAADPNDMVPRLILVWERLEPGQITKEQITDLPVSEFNKLLKRIVLAIREALKDDARTQERTTMEQYADALNDFFRGMYDAQKRDEASAHTGLCCDDPDCPVRKMTVELIEKGDARLAADGVLEVRNGVDEVGMLMNMLQQLLRQGGRATKQDQGEPKLEPELQKKWESLRKKMSKDS